MHRHAFWHWAVLPRFLCSWHQELLGGFGAELQEFLPDAHQLLPSTEPTKKDGALDRMAGGAVAFFEAQNAGVYQMAGGVSEGVVARRLDMTRNTKPKK